MSSYRRSFFMTNQVANKALIPLLRSRMGAALGSRLAVVEYAGRRSGRHHELVTQYTRDGRTVRINVGGAEHKTWWRNFREPERLRLRIAGVDHQATARLDTHDSRTTVVVELDD